MIGKLQNHYSFTHPSSVYDEEALTSLELAGRTAQKMNEVIEATNKNTETVNEAKEYMVTNLGENSKTYIDSLMKAGAIKVGITYKNEELTLIAREV